MEREHTTSDSTQRDQAINEFIEADTSETPFEIKTIHTGPKYETTERIFRLLHLLTANNCSRDDIFGQLRDYYKIGEEDDSRVKASSQRAGRMLRRDLHFLQNMGFQINETHTDNTIRYSLVKGTGPGSTFLFNQTELDTLILLHALFADPARYTPATAMHPLPASTPHNPFAEQIVALVERLVATLPATQKKHFDRWVRKPFVYLNMDTVTDYLPHRNTIDTLVNFILGRQQIQFEYGSMNRAQNRSQETLLHEEVDPYYIVHQDGHLYLIGYTHATNTVLEYRVDRIKSGTIKPSPQHKLIDIERRPKPIEFRYWLDSSIAKSGLSLRWLTQTIEREEPYIDEQGKQHSRILIRATAYSEWRILQQMHKYGDKAELVSPPEQREKMRKEVARMHNYYQK